MKNLYVIFFAFITLTLQAGNEQIWVNTDEISMMKSDPYGRGTTIQLSSHEIIVLENLETIFSKISRQTRQ